MSTVLEALAYLRNLVKKLQYENRELRNENLKLREQLAQYFTENKKLRAKVKRGK